MTSDIGGVWRTIGGRRVFIKDGQDLSTAMKESGKFKLSKKQIEAGKKLNENAINGAKKDIEEYLKGNNEDWDNDEDFIKDLANEWGLDKEEVDNLFNSVNQKEKQKKIGTTEYLMQKQREKGNYKDEKYNELQSKANEVIKSLKKMSNEELKDELYHNDGMLREMERRLSKRYKLSDEERDRLELRAAHYESIADDIREELRQRRNK